MGAIVLGTLTIIFSYIISFVAGRYGIDVSARFLERDGFIPSTQEALTKKSLERWLNDPITGRNRRPYALYVIPLDFIFILLLAAFMAIGSLSLLEAIVWPHPLTPWQWSLPWIAPAVYVLSDAAEDVLIMSILLGSNVVNGGFYGAMRAATRIKVLFAVLALLQTAALGFWALRVSNV